MRLSTIAVCLLLMSPSPVLACWKDTPEQTGWFQEIRSPYGDSAMGGAGETTMPAWTLAGAGLASMALMVVSFRAFSGASGRGPMPGRNPYREAPAIDKFHTAPPTRTPMIQDETARS